MALTVNTNIFSLNAQRNLRQVEGPLQTAMQRLSSGLRINSAKDDAAGFAISTRQTTQINGLSQAVRNANDGVSFAQTAEGAMDEMITSLQRINELSIQSANNNTAKDRESIDEEVQQLISELNRIVSQTRFNGETFLNKSKSINVQVGAEVNETINVSTSNVAPTTLGVSTTYADSLDTSDIAQSAFATYDSSGLGSGATIAGQDIGDAISTASDYQNNSQNLINRINEYTGDHDVTAFSHGNALVGNNTAMAATDSSGGTVDAGYLTINGTQIGSFSLSSSSTSGIANLVSAINNESTNTSVSAHAVDSVGAVVTDYTDGSRIVLANDTGAGISVSMDSGVSGGSLVSTHNFASGTTSVDAGQNGKIILNSGLTTTSVSFDGSGTGSALGVVASTGSGVGSVSLTQTSVNSLSVTNVANANISILATKTALDSISSEKAKLGAAQNRFETTISNLENVRENAVQARSRIRDADFAEETANLTKNQILQQAGISVLSQANQLTQNVLALLQ